MNQEAIIYKEITEEELENVFDLVNRDVVYGTEMGLLRRVLSNPLFRLNVDPDIVSMKIALIDVTNSTHLHQKKRMISLVDLTGIITNPKLRFDERVSRGDELLVTEIACCNGKINLFSFATKYCFYHNSFSYGKDDYAKYDGIVSICLPYYLNKAGIRYKGRRITSSTLNSLRIKKDYETFNMLVDSVLKNISVPNKKAKYDYLMWYYNRGNGNDKE